MRLSRLLPRRFRRPDPPPPPPVPVVPDVDRMYAALCGRPSDIHEHLPLLRDRAAECASVLECGMRGCVSTWAFLKGLKESPAPDRSLVSCDLEYHENVEAVKAAAASEDIAYTFVAGDDTRLGFDPADLVFIDTWHVYGHLKRELAHLAPRARKYIILHDTTIDGENGESLRLGWDIAAQSAESGYPESEIARGIWPAVEEFLAASPEWRLLERRNNNNGLTVLARPS